MWGLRLTCACPAPPPPAGCARGHCRARATARATASGVSQSPRGGERRRPQPLARASRVPRRSECAPIRSCELEVPGRHLLATAPAAREEPAAHTPGAAKQSYCCLRSTLRFLTHTLLRAAGHPSPTSSRVPPSRAGDPGSDENKVRLARAAPLLQACSAVVADLGWQRLHRACSTPGAVHPAAAAAVPSRRAPRCCCVITPCTPLLLCRHAVHPAAAAAAAVAAVLLLRAMPPPPLPQLLRL